MSEIKIALWHSAQNKDSEVFLNHFQDDLRRCMLRLGKQASIYQNTEVDSSFKIVILSNADNIETQTEPWYAQLVKDSNALVLILSPLDNDIINNLKFSTVYPFWEKVFETGELLNIRRDIHTTQAKYWEKITDISFRLISEKNKKNNPQTTKTVYLSQGDIYLSTDRENIKRDLNDIGFTVLPDKPFSSDINECTSQIIQCLDKTELIINIVPPIYTPFFLNQHLSLAEHQCNVTAEYIKKKPNSKRIIWIPSTYEISDEENQIFVEKLQRDHDQTLQTTVLKTSIEELKKYYKSILNKGISKTEITPENLGAYIILDSMDNGIRKGVQVLLERKVNSIKDNFSGITYKQHLTNLANARNVIICYSSQNEQWLAVKINDVLKSRGMGSYRKIDNLILYLTEDIKISSKHKSAFSKIVRNMDELSTLQINEN
ncbi:MAG: hypothetical protein ACLFNU_03180 [Bacteroidales bacterium]